MYSVSKILIDVKSVLCGYLRCSLVVAVGAGFRFFASTAAVHVCLGAIRVIKPPIEFGNL